MGDDIVKQTYDQLSTKINVGDEKAFRNAMKKESDARQIYQMAIDAGFNAGDYESFSRAMGVQKEVAPVEKPKKPKESEGQYIPSEPGAQKVGGDYVYVDKPNKQGLTPVVYTGPLQVSKVEQTRKPVTVSGAPFWEVEGQLYDEHNRPVVVKDGFATAYASDGTRWIYRIDAPKKVLVRSISRNGDQSRYDENGKVTAVIEAPRSPAHFGDNGGLVYWTSDPAHPWAANNGILNYATSHDIGRKGDHSGMSEAQLSSEAKRLEGIIAGSTPGSPEYDDAVGQYKDVIFEQLAKASNYGSYREARGNAGEFAWRRFKYKVAKEYPCTLSSSLLDGSIVNNPRVNNPSAVFDKIIDSVSNAQQTAIYNDETIKDKNGIAREGAFYENLVARATKGEVMNSFYQLCLGKAKKTGRDVNGIIDEEWKKALMKMHGLTEEKLDERLQSNLDKMPGWLKFATNTLDRMIVGKAVKYLVLNKQERHQFDLENAKYNKQIGGWQEFFSEGLGLAGDYPIYYLTGGGIGSMIGKEGMQLAAGRFIHSTLNMTAIGLIGQGLDDLDKGEFSGPMQWFNTGIHSAIAGATLYGGGELTSKILVKPTSFGRVAWNKGAGYTIEAVSFSLPTWVEACYAGRTPEGEPLSAGYFLHSGLHNLGVVVGMKGKENFKGWKPAVNKTDISQLRHSYPSLYKAIDENMGLMTRGKQPNELTGEAMADFRKLQEDMATHGKGVSWQTYRKTMNLFGYEVIPPTPSSVRRDGRKLQLLDSGGNVITENTYKNSAEAKRDEATLQKSIEKIEEDNNAAHYTMGRVDQINYEVCADMAERRNGGVEWRKKNADGTFAVDENGRYIADEEYMGYTPDSIDEMVRAAEETPEAQRTAEQRQLLSEYESGINDLANKVPDADAIAEQICEQYGITTDALKEVLKKAPSERNPSDKAAQAAVALNSALARGPMSLRPVGKVKTASGEIEVYNEANPKNKNDYYFYKDENGETKMISTKDVGEFTPIVDERQQSFEASEKNANDAVKKVLDSYREVYRMYDDGLLEREIQRKLDSHGLVADENGQITTKAERHKELTERQKEIEDELAKDEYKGEEEGVDENGNPVTTSKALEADILERKRQLEAELAECKEKIQELGYDGKEPTPMDEADAIELNLLLEEREERERRDKDWGSVSKDTRTDEEKARDLAGMIAADEGLDAKEFNARVEELSKYYVEHPVELNAELSKREEAERNAEKELEEGQPETPGGEPIQTEGTPLQTEGESIEAEGEVVSADGQIKTEGQNVEQVSGEPSAVPEQAPEAPVEQATGEVGRTEVKEPAEGEVKDATEETPSTETDPLQRQKAEAFVSAYFPTLKGDAREARIQEVMGSDFESTVRFDKEDGVNKEKTDAYDAAVAELEKPKTEPVEQEPVETPQPENAMQPAEVPEAKKEVAKTEETETPEAERDRKINELLDFMGLKGKDREYVRNAYLAEPKKLEEEYNELQRELQKADEASKEKTEKKPEVKPEEKKDEEPVAEEEKKEDDNVIVDDPDTPMPTKEVKGRKVPDYSKSTPSRTRKFIYEDLGYDKETADGVVNDAVSAAKDALKKHKKAEPKRPKPDEVFEYAEKKAAWDAKQAELEGEQAYWEEVANLQKTYDLLNEVREAKSPKQMSELVNKLRQRYGSTHSDPEMYDALTNYRPKSLYEACMQFLASDVRFVWDAQGSKKGLKQQTGWGDGERKKMLSMIAKEENGGITPEAAVHRIVDLYGEDLGFGLDQSDVILNTLLEALQSVKTKGDAYAFINARKLANVEDILLKRINGEGRGREDAEADRRADEEFEALKEQYKDELPENPTVDDVANLMERKRQESKEVDVEGERQGEETLPNETSGEFEAPSGEFEAPSDEVPFQKGDVAKPEQPKTKQARNFTARTIKKLRKAGVRVKTATQEEAQRVMDIARKVGAQFQAVFHGSGNDFDAFDHSHMGEGEGAQAYGWGTYVTQVLGIARTYAKSSAAKSVGIKFRGADDVAAIEKMFPDQNPDSKPISREIINIIRDIRIGYTFDEAKSYAVESRKNWLLRHQNALEEYRKGIEAKEKIIERIENMSDEEYANTNFWDEANIAAYDNNNKENAAFFAWKRAAAIRAGNHRGRELTKEELLTELRKNLRDEKIYTLKDYEAAVKDAQDAYDFVNGLEESDFEVPTGGRFVYDVEVPDNDGTNYIPYNSRLTEAQLQKIRKGLQKIGARQVEGNHETWQVGEGDYGKIVLNPNATGADIYAELRNLVEKDPNSLIESISRGSDKVASEFLHECGFVGIEYPAQYRSGGRSDNAKNYVIFNEGDAKITNKTEFLMTKDGKVYGWHDSEGIHLTEEGFNPDTPLHEYTHGFMRMLKETDPKTYSRVVEGLKESEVWQEVLNDEAYKDLHNDETAVASEVAARLSGRENASRVNTEFDRENIISYANAVAVGARVKNALRTFWDNIAEWFGAKLDKAMPADRFARMTLRALEKGVNPDAVVEDVDVEMMGSRTDKRMAEIGKFFEGKDLTETQRAVVDVYSGNTSKNDISVSRNDGTRTYEIMQGSEPKAGTKHSVFRHYNTNDNYITTDDIIKIPDIIKNGDRVEEDNGNISYSLKYGEDTLTFVTRPKGGKERMVTFYSDREAPKTLSQNTPNGARTNASDALSGRKDTPEFSVVQENGEKTTDGGERYRDGEEQSPTASLAERMRERWRERMARAREAVSQPAAENATEVRQENAEPQTETRTENGGGGENIPPTEPPTPQPAPRAELPPTEFDRPATPIEQALGSAMKVITDTSASMEDRNAARKELSGTLRDLTKAMRIQKDYDKATVENVVAFAREMVNSGLIDHEELPRMNELFTAIKRGTGKTPKGLETVVNRMVDIMLKSQERQAQNEISRLLNTKAVKVDDNSVQKQGAVDLRGQHMLAEMNYLNEKNLVTDAQIKSRIDELQDRRDKLNDNHPEAEELDNRIAAAQTARAYLEPISNLNENIRRAENELDWLKKQHKNGDISDAEYRESKKATENLIRDYKIKRAEALWDYANGLNGVVVEGREGAKGFIAEQQAHADEIRHNAYSDMQGAPTTTQTRPGTLAKIASTPLPRFFSATLGSLNVYLKRLSKHVLGEGYLYNRFMRGWVDSREAEITEWRNDLETLNNKAQELFGTDYYGLIDKIRKLPTMDVPYRDGGEMKSHVLEQSQLMYIYMLNKMDDAIPALRAMGISEEKVKQIEEHLDDNVKALADWLQGEFLANKHAGYNEVHRRLFGTDMDRVENYVPIMRDVDQLKKEVDIAKLDEGTDLNSTTVSGIKKRIHTNAGIDIMNTNLIDMIGNHLREMNHWKNFAEWNKDANTLLSDTGFKKRVKNTTTAMGSGKELLDGLTKAFAIAGGSYKPKTTVVDNAATNLAKNFTAAKVSLRLHTAAKQLLSLPVFATECNTAYLLKNLGELFSPKTSAGKGQNAWAWCWDNLPVFRERWQSRIAGDIRLENTDFDWGWTKQKIVQNATKIGLTPNAFIDACTVAVGAKSVYETRFEQYKKMGYSEADADRRAKQDATIAFNETQQSSEKAFVSELQADRTWLSAGLTVFRNASIGYERKLYMAVDRLKYMATHDKGEIMEYMTKQMVRDGLTETQAQRAAKRIYRRGIYRNLLNLAMFSVGAQFAWNMGGQLPYMVFGDDGDEKNKIMKDAAVRAVMGGWLEGLPLGDEISSGLGNYGYNWFIKDNDEQAKKFFEFNPELLPVSSDIQKMFQHFDSKNDLRGYNDLLNILGTALTGVNPATITDAGVAILDACNGDMGMSKEVGYCILRIMQCPQSQLEQMYIDELKMTGAEARGFTAEQLANRYAYYKLHKDVPALWWIYDKEKENEIIGNYTEQFEKKLKTRTNDVESLNEFFFEAESTKTKEKRLDALCKKLKEEGDVVKIQQLIDAENARAKREYTDAVPGWSRSYVDRLTNLKRELEGRGKKKEEKNAFKMHTLSEMDADEKAPIVIPSELIPSYDDLRTTLEEEYNDPDIKELAKYGSRGKSGKNRGKWYPKSKADKPKFDAAYAKCKEKADRYLKHYLIYEYDVAAPLKAYSSNMSEEDKKRLNDTIIPALNGWDDPNYNILIPKWSEGKKKKK